MSISSEAYRLTACEGKEAFASYAHADRVAKRMRGGATAYRCNACRQWHVGGNEAGRRGGSKPKRKGRR